MVCGSISVQWIQRCKGCQGAHMWLGVANVASMVAGPVNGPCQVLMRLDMRANTLFYGCI